MQLAAVSLPDSLQWVNEYEHNQVEQEIERSLTGALLVQEGAKTFGRPIHMVGGLNGGWILKSTADAMRALEATAGAIMECTLPDGSTHSVIFDRSQGPAFKSQMIMRFAYPDADTWYTCEFRLLTVEPPTP